MSSNNLQHLIISFIKDLHSSKRCPICNHLFLYNSCIGCQLSFIHEYRYPILVYKGFYMAPKSKNYPPILTPSRSTIDLSNHNISSINDLIHLINKIDVFK